MEENTTSSVTPESDAQSVEQQTTTAPSSGEQTAQTETAGTTETTEAAKSVPEINRYAEEARKARKEADQLRAELEQTKRANAPEPDPTKEAIKAQLDPILKDMGYVHQDYLRQQELDRQTAAELTRLEETYNGSDGRPKFDRQEMVDWILDESSNNQYLVNNVELAYKTKYEKELTDWAVKQAMTKGQGIKTEASDGSGSQEVGTTDSDLVKAAQNGDHSAVRTFLKRLAPKV